VVDAQRLLILLGTFVLKVPWFTTVVANKFISLVGSGRVVIILVLGIVEGRMGERGQHARREHSREVVRQRMLHAIERRGMGCGTQPHDWKPHELESMKRTPLSKTNE
jgi:hypothetical protein